MKNTNAILLEPVESILIVVDLQEKFVPFLRHPRRVLQATNLILEAAKVIGIPVIVTEHHPEAIGPTVPEIDLPRNDRASIELIRKDTFSCLRDEKIIAALKKRKKNGILIITGCETHICIMQTAIDALKEGYGVFVVADAVDSRSDLDWRTGLDRIGAAGGVIATSEMVVYELLKRSDTPQFKKMLPILKRWSTRQA